jgi:hypothetical protein
LVVHYPSCARQLPADAVAQLGELQAADARALHEIVTELRHEPADLTAQFLQRKVGSHGYARLAELAQQDSMVADAASALKELAATIQKLLAQAQDQRWQELLDKQQLEPLSAEEMQELQRLMSIKAGQRSGRKKPI